MTDISAAAVSTAHLDYLQRIGQSPLPLPAEPSAVTPVAARRLRHVTGIGVRAMGQPSATDDSRSLLTGLYGAKLPLAFLITGAAGGVSVHVGTWAPPKHKGAGVLEAREHLLVGLLEALHPAVFHAPASPDARAHPVGGLVLGTPVASPPGSVDGLDRLIQAMSGTTWAALVTAEPLDEGYAARLRGDVINELRSNHAAELASGAPSPLAEHYAELLRAKLVALSEGLAVGAWRVGVCLTGERRSYPRLASAWRSVYSGERSLPDAIQVWDAPNTTELADGWAMPYQPGPPGPGHYRHPFRHQTLLSTGQLAAYVRLPTQECPGFAVRAIAAFDVARRPLRSARVVRLARVMHLRRVTDEPYELAVDDLARHAFVGGVTGSGKTKTLMHLLGELDAAAVPFLVIEPAKAEYRALLRRPEMGARVRVFTLGDERLSPFRLNPFEVPTGTTVAQHVDLLRAVFATGFGMWTPLPQMLERCLHELYADRGWDLGADENCAARRRRRTRSAFPTLTDLVGQGGRGRADARLRASGSLMTSAPH